ncbi:MAG: biopolymer transporter ExbD [Gemmatimonadaceae bacterium]|nr:biopolymer transporter ExbD [Gemmatimonadaceae bacterium]
MSRMRDARQARRAATFAKFRVTQLNLVPLVDTFVSIVFFALTTQTVGELAPVVPGVNLPETSVGTTAFSQLTLGVGATVTLAGRPVMSTLDAATAASDDPEQPLLIPLLHREMRRMADSLRTARGLARDAALDVPLAIQGDRTMRYDLLSRFMQTARSAGFTRISLQVQYAAPETRGP